MHENNQLTEFMVKFWEDPGCFRISDMMSSSNQPVPRNLIKIRLNCHNWSLLLECRSVSKPHMVFVRIWSLSLTVRKNNHYAHDSTASIDLVSVAVFFNDFLQIRQCSNYLSSNDAVERNVPLRGIFVGWSNINVLIQTDLSLFVPSRAVVVFFRNLFILRLIRCVVENDTCHPAVKLPTWQFEKIIVMLTTFCTLTKWKEKNTFLDWS